MQIAPALGEATLGLKRCAATVLVHQIHRLACVVAGVDGSQAAAGTLFSGGFITGSNCGPELGDHRAPVSTPSVKHCNGATRCNLHLRAPPEEAGPAAVRLPAGQLN